MRILRRRARGAKRPVAVAGRRGPGQARSRSMIESPRTDLGGRRPAGPVRGRRVAVLHERRGGRARVVLEEERREAIVLKAFAAHRHRRRRWRGEGGRSGATNAPAHAAIRVCHLQTNLRVRGCVNKSGFTAFLLRAIRLRRSSNKCATAADSIEAGAKRCEFATRGGTQAEQWPHGPKWLPHLQKPTMHHRRTTTAWTRRRRRRKLLIRRTTTCQK